MSLLKAYLEHIRVANQELSPEEARRAIGSSSSQFTATDLRPIEMENDKRLDHLLRHRFLARAASHVARRDASTIGEGGTEQIESKLHNFLLRQLGFPAVGSHVLRRAAPREFLSASVARGVKQEGIKIPRVLVGEHDVVLIDGLRLSGTSKNYIRDRATKISFNYFQLAHVRADVETFDKKRMSRVAVLFDEDANAGNDPIAEYAVATLRRDSDMVFSSQHPTKEFVDAAKRAAAGLPGLG